jgi:F0F1-type ATP synthase assembly protein I
MAADWDKVADTYSDAVATVLPLRRFVLVGVGMLEAASIRHQNYDSVALSMAMHPLKSLSTEAGRLFDTATVADVCLALGLAVAAWALSVTVLKALFRIASGAVDLHARMRKVMGGEAGNLAIKSLDDLDKLTKFVDSALAGARKKLKSIYAAAELCAGIAVAAFVGAYWGNILDVLIGLGAFVVMIGLHIIGLQVFLSRYMGPALLQARYLGQPLPEPGSASD